MNLSFTEENYLKAILQLTQNHENASTNAIARQLNTSAASVTDMMNRLADKDLINYVKYKGVSLTESGMELATQLVRKHRLWETFLVETLGYDWAEVHDIAEQLEHVKSSSLINRLDKFLGYPSFDPHGDPIPTAEGKLPQRQLISLKDVEEGDEVFITKVTNDKEEFLKFLNELQLQIGKKLRVIKKMTFDESIQVVLDNKQTVLLSKSVCEQIMVKISK